MESAYGEAQLEIEIEKAEKPINTVRQSEQHCLTRNEREIAEEDRPTGKQTAIERIQKEPTTATDPAHAGQRYS